MSQKKDSNPNHSVNGGAKFWRTSISKVEPNKILIRGCPIEKLMERTFGDVVYLLFTGHLPSGNEGKMIEAILISGCDHSLAAPSANAVRFVASSGVPLQASVAAGIISLGDYHGGAIEQAAKLFQESLRNYHGDIDSLAIKIVERYKAEKKRILGFGHPYHTKDPRTSKLIQLAEKYGVKGKHVELALAIEKELEKGGKSIPLNVDGTIGAIISDLGIDYRYGKGFYVIARSAGLTAHAYEQMMDRPFKAVSLEEIEYVGEEDGCNENPD
jgi:citrate synthase